MNQDDGFDELTVDQEVRDIADVPAVEVINTVAVHLLSAAAVKVGLADDPDAQLDLDEARKLIDALAGLVTACRSRRSAITTPARCATDCARFSSRSARPRRSRTSTARAPARSGPARSTSRS